LILGYRLSSCEEFLLAPIHPPLVAFSGPSDTHLLPCSAAILDDLLDKMGDLGVPTISCLIDT
jgi:hypothetical protein